MFCTQCGQEKADNDRFCRRCGRPLTNALAEVASERKECWVEFKITGERWGIFPRDEGVFQAYRSEGDNVVAVGQPVKIELESCSFDGPKKTNRRHTKALEKLTGQLTGEGWQLCETPRPEWYNLRFFRYIEKH
ncbi:MAG TPA: zinc-ribbon domain-containing protein [Patescibacteria group bacterium]|nr:zinc-ribbon domain-containing protein [Patescibacteria group bacterium]